MISSYVGENAEFERQMLSGELDVECLKELLLKSVALHKQVYLLSSPTGYGEVAEGKEVPNSTVKCTSWN
jgi:3-oxoacid CoA-transferase subunit A